MQLIYGGNVLDLKGLVCIRFEEYIKKSIMIFLYIFFMVRNWSIGYSTCESMKIITGDVNFVFKFY